MPDRAWYVSAPRWARNRTGPAPGRTHSSRVRKVDKSALRCPLRRALAPLGGPPYSLPPKNPNLRRFFGRLVQNFGLALRTRRRWRSQIRMYPDSIPPSIVFSQPPAAALPAPPDLSSKLRDLISIPVQQMPPCLPATHFGGSFILLAFHRMISSPIRAYIVRPPYTGTYRTKANSCAASCRASLAKGGAPPGTEGFCTGTLNRPPVGRHDPGAPFPVHPPWQLVPGETSM